MIPLFCQHRTASSDVCCCSHTDKYIWSCIGK